MNPYKERFAPRDDARTLAEALEGADVFVGVSVGRAGDAARCSRRMARDPIVFAMANPDPEILPDEATAARPDVIMATGRSDYPNQVNNVLGFPFIFRGALDVPREPDQRGDEARGLARPRRPRQGGRARRGRPRLRRRGASASGATTSSPSRSTTACSCASRRRWPRPPRRAASRAGRIEDLDAYRDRLAGMLSPSRSFMQVIHDKARRAPEAGRLRRGRPPQDPARGQDPRRGGHRPADPRLERREGRATRLDALELKAPVEVVDPESHPSFAEYVEAYYDRRKRHGVTREDAVAQMRSAQLLRAR